MVHVTPIGEPGAGLLPRSAQPFRSVRLEWADCRGDAVLAAGHSMKCALVCAHVHVGMKFVFTPVEPGARGGTVGPTLGLTSNAADLGRVRLRASRVAAFLLALGTLFACRGQV
jgi:hypothetical protein